MSIIASLCRWISPGEPCGIGVKNTGGALKSGLLVMLVQMVIQPNLSNLCADAPSSPSSIDATPAPSGAPPVLRDSQAGAAEGSPRLGDSGKKGREEQSDVSVAHGLFSCDTLRRLPPTKPTSSRGGGKNLTLCI